jgi:hypothetical protein
LLIVVNRRFINYTPEDLRAQYVVFRLRRPSSLLTLFADISGADSAALTTPFDSFGHPQGASDAPSAVIPSERRFRQNFLCYLVIYAL